MKHNSFTKVKDLASEYLGGKFYFFEKHDTALGKPWVYWYECKHDGRQQIPTGKEGEAPTKKLALKTIKNQNGRLPK